MVTSEAVLEPMAQCLSIVDLGFNMEVLTDKQLQGCSQVAMSKSDTSIHPS